MAFNHKHS